MIIHSECMRVERAAKCNSFDYFVRLCSGKS